MSIALTQPESHAARPLAYTWDALETEHPDIAARYDTVFAVEYAADLIGKMVETRAVVHLRGDIFSAQLWHDRFTAPHSFHAIKGEASAKLAEAVKRFRYDVELLALVDPVVERFGEAWDAHRDLSALEWASDREAA